IRQRLQIGLNCCPVVLHSHVQSIASHKTIYGQCLLQNVLNIGLASLATSEPIPKLIYSARKSGFERVDVVLGTLFVNAPIRECHVETPAEPVGALLQSLKYDVDLTVGDTVRLSLPLCAHADGCKHEQDRQKQRTF